MSIVNGYPYRDMTPDDVRALIRRAHAERSAAMRQLFADLLWRRRTAVERRTASEPALNSAEGAFWIVDAQPGAPVPTR